MMFQKLAFSILRRFPSLVEQDLTQLSKPQKALLGMRHYLTMSILEKENTAETYLRNKNS